jgi:hypothetical protein
MSQTLNTAVAVVGVPGSVNAAITEEIIDKHQLALEQVQTVSAEPTALGHDHPFPASLWNVNLRGDRVRPVQDAWCATGVQAGQLAGEGESISARRCGRPRCKHELDEHLFSGNTLYLEASAGRLRANKLARFAWAVLNKGRAFECVKANEMTSRPT